MKPWFLGYRGHRPWEGCSREPAGKASGEVPGIIVAEPVKRRYTQGSYGNQDTTGR
jgi:hypothetical protein